MFYCLLSPVIGLKPRAFTRLLIAPQDSATARTLSTEILRYSMSRPKRYLDGETYHSLLSIAWSYVLSKTPAAQAGSNLALISVAALVIW